MSTKPSKSGPSGPRLLGKKDITDLEAVGVKLRRQMDVHVTCLESKSSSKLELVQEWHEYLKKRSEIEVECAKKLDKLSDHTIERINRLKKSGKDSTINACSTTAMDLLQAVVTDNKGLANRKMAFCDDVINEVLPRLDMITKDVNVATRRVREGFTVAHEEIKKAHTELMEAVKAYMAAGQASEESQSKLSKIQASRSKGKNVDKDAKKEIKMLEGLMSNKFRAITCRNEYIMALEWFNKLCRLYFSKWSSEMFEFFDFEFHHELSCVQRLEGELEKSVALQQTKNINGCLRQLEYLSPTADLQKFQSANTSAFPSHTEVVFLPATCNDKNGLFAVSGVYEGMATMRTNLTMEIGQISYKIDEAHRALLDAQESFNKSQDTIYGESAIADCIEEEARLQASKNRTHMASAMSSVLTSRREQHDSICSTFNKVAENMFELTKKYTLSDMLDNYMKDLTDVQVKKNTQALATESLKNEDATVLSHLDKYMMENSNKIPPIITSCIRYVEEHGPTVEGVFRVPGTISQIEEMMELFDDDKDPLYGSEATGSYDLHAAASLLKQYLRELPEPVFPFSVFQRIIDVQTRSLDQEEKAAELESIMKDLPENRLTVLREIMRFLDEFSQHASATKMNSNNLALVFGPTLLAAPPEMDAVTLAQHTTSINLVTLFMVENRLTIFGEPTPQELKAQPSVDEEPDQSSTPEGKIKPTLFTKLEVSLMQALNPVSEPLPAQAAAEYSSVTTPSGPQSTSSAASAGSTGPPFIPGLARNATYGEINVSVQALQQRRSSLRGGATAEPRSTTDRGSHSSIQESEEGPVYACPLRHTRTSISSAGSDKPDGDGPPDASLPSPTSPKGTNRTMQTKILPAGAQVELAKKRSSVPAVNVSGGDAESDDHQYDSPKKRFGSEGDDLDLNASASASSLASAVAPVAPPPSSASAQSSTASGSTSATSIGTPGVPTPCSTPGAATPIATPTGTPNATPSPLASIDTKSTSESMSSPVPGRKAGEAGQQVKASHAYTARTAKELSFTKGAIIDVYAKSPDGNWWDSIIDGKRGYIPASYVKPVPQ